MSITQPIKWHGGKHYLAPKIVALMPRHRHYVEPYAGGLSVLLERDPNDERLWWGMSSSDRGVSEVVNDIHGELINFWRVLRCDVQFPRFVQMCQATALDHDAYNVAGGVQDEEDEAALAWAFFVRARQSRAGNFKGFTSLTRNRTRRGINGNASEWLGAVDGLPEVHARLRPVVIENLDALKIIKREDTEATLFYLDPPYLHETRTTKDAYAHEMTEADHRALLEVLCGLEGKFMLSGYHSPLYDEYAGLMAWDSHEFDIANHAAGGKSKRRETEVLWCNFTGEK